jgi:CubicO group peptidase (beta-lactamase class C family)
VKALLALAAVGCAPVGEDPPERPVDRFADIQNALDAEHSTSGARGISVGIIEGGELVATLHAGEAEAGRPLTDETLYRIGSVTKVLTATAALRQVAAGALDLDAPITDVLPEFSLPRTPDCAPHITARDLLSHQSTLVDYLEVDTTGADSALATFVDRQMASFYCWDTPGSFWNYSNTGFYVAGRAVEATAGLDYPTVMATDVFAPLGMNRTFFRPNDVAEDGDYAVGATVDWEGGGAPRDAGPRAYDNAWARPAGYAWSNIPDLAKFLRFLMRGDSEFLPDALREELSDPQIVTWNIADRERYGLGLFTSEGVLSAAGFHPTPMWTHGGNIPGFTAGIYVLPQLDAAAVFLASGDYVALPETLRAWFSMLELPPAEPASPLAFDPALAEAIVGTWRDPWNIGETRIWADGDTIHIAAPDLDALEIPYDAELVPAGAGTVSWRVQGVQALFQFVPDDAGDIRWMRARFSVSTRVDDGASDAPTSEVAPAAERRARVLDALGQLAPAPLDLP